MSIEEMALKAYPKEIIANLQEIRVGAKPIQLDHNEAKRVIYIEGAIAVLEEIDKFIAELPCKSDGELVNQKMLWQRVKQLKG